MLNTEPKVSVCVATYNQERYIHQCLQSIVDQKTDFDFEVIVADDCSSDGTVQIVRNFAEKYPSIIRPTYHKQNIGIYANFAYIHQQATGQYIAHIDGDDYALPGKLQAQVDVLDSEQNCNIVFHRMRMLIDSDGQMLDDRINVEIMCNMRFTRADLLRFGVVGWHSSKMSRAKYRHLDRIPHPSLDYYEHIINVDSGYARILSEFYGIYRRSSSSVTIVPLDEEKRMYLQHLEDFLKLYPQYGKEIAENALMVALADGKNFRRTFWWALSIFLKELSIQPIIGLIRSWKIRLACRLPKKGL